MLWTISTKSGRVYSLQGKTNQNTDSSSVSGEIVYEKMPHFDDVGYITVAEDGQFELLLVNNKHYIFTIKAQRFENFSQELKVQEQEKVHLFALKEVESFKLHNLIFRRGSSEIPPYSHAELDRLADWLEEDPTISIRLEGHTDFRGDPNKNMLLSELRVEEVKKYLVKVKGIKKQRLMTKAFGGTQPLSRENTQEAEALNRRVVVTIIDK